jgi:CelD/BcsL family acetyltransferase involved in cellulose biosynthesis
MPTPRPEHLATAGRLTVATVPMSEWDAALAALPGRTVFHGADYLGVLAEHHGLEPLLVRVDEAGRCVALWPCLVQRKGPLRVLGSPLSGWCTPYMGPVLAPGAEAARVVRAVLDSRVLGRSSYFEVRVLAGAGDCDLTPFGFTRRLDFETYVLDVDRAEDELTRNLHYECRRMVKRARQRGIEVRAETDVGFVDEFMAMSEQVFARWGKRPQYDGEFLRRLWRRLSPSGSVLALSSWLDGKRLTTYFLLRDAQTMYACYAASWDAARPTGSGNLTQWEAILAAKRGGLRHYDFISASGSAGAFKATFGPERRLAATHWSKAGSRLEAALKDVYEEFLRFRRGA